MTDLFAGGEMGGFVPSDSSVVESTTGVRYDTAFARCAILVEGGTAYADSWEFAGQTDIWVHFEVFNNVINGAQSFLRLLNSSGTEVVNISTVGSGASAFIWQVQYLSGVMTNLGSTVAVSNARQTVDLHVDIANDTVKLYVAGTLRMTATGTDLSGLTNIAQIRLASTEQSAFSQVIASTNSTIGRRLMTAPVTGTGATDQWTASYASVDDVVYSDADFIFSDTADQVELMTVTPVGSTSGYTVAGVAVNARANTDGTGPQNLRLAVRGGSTTAFSGSDLPLDAGYGAYCGIFATDPSTTLAWASVTGVQVGVKSIA